MCITQQVKQRVHADQHFTTTWQMTCFLPGDRRKPWNSQSHDWGRSLRTTCIPSPSSLCLYTPEHHIFTCACTLRFFNLQLGGHACPKTPHDKQDWNSHIFIKVLFSHCSFAQVRKSCHLCHWGLPRHETWPNPKPKEPVQLLTCDFCCKQQ